MGVWGYGRCDVCGTCVQRLVDGAVASGQGGGDERCAKWERGNADGTEWPLPSVAKAECASSANAYDARIVGGSHGR